MNPNSNSCFSVLLLAITFITLVPTTLTEDDSVLDTVLELASRNGWVNPDAWNLKRSRSEGDFSQQLSTCTCPPTNCEIHKNPRSTNDIPKEAIYYMQLVNRLFNRKKFRHVESNLMARTINIRLTDTQLQQIEALLTDNDIHDLAELVTVLMQKFNDNFKDSVKDEVLSLYETVHQHYNQLVKVKHGKFAFYVAVFFLTTFLISRLSGHSFILIALLAVPCIGLGGAYVKCNRQKELDQLISFKQKEFQDNPCDHVNAQQTWLSRLFFQSNKDACIEHLQKINHDDSDFCEPMEVVIDYGTAMMSKVIKGSIALFTTSTEGKSYIHQALVGAIIVSLCIAFGKVFISTTISSVFKHGFSNIFAGAPRVEQQQQQPSQQQQQYQELSGSGVELIREFMLTWRQNMTQQEKYLEMLSNKGIDVKEAIDLLEKLKGFEVAAVKNRANESKDNPVEDLNENEASGFEFVESIGTVDEITENLEETKVDAEEKKDK